MTVALASGSDTGAMSVIEFRTDRSKLSKGIRLIYAKTFAQPCTSVSFSSSFRYLSTACRSTVFIAELVWPGVVGDALLGKSRGSRVSSDPMYPHVYNGYVDDGYCLLHSYKCGDVSLMSPVSSVPCVIEHSRMSVENVVAVSWNRGNEPYELWLTRKNNVDGMKWNGQKGVCRSGVAYRGMMV